MSVEAQSKTESSVSDVPTFPITMNTSRDNGVVRIDPRAIKKSKVLSDMVSNLNIDMNDPNAFADSLDCPVGNKEALEKVVEWCTANHDKPDRKHDDDQTALTDEDIKFMEISNDLLVQIANFFDINDLLEIITQKIANMAKDKNTDQLRRIFMLPDDLTPDEKEAIRKKHEWAAVPMRH